VGVMLVKEIRSVIFLLKQLMISDQTEPKRKRRRTMCTNHVTRVTYCLVRLFPVRDKNHKTSVLSSTISDGLKKNHSRLEVSACALSSAVYI